ncbi:MAG: hypothetical protein QHI48_07700, partial [Bacteroidota bacterium]|nr:hypothetical protein [Bacteroidota bacterium]
MVPAAVASPNTDKPSILYRRWVRSRDKRTRVSSTGKRTSAGDRRTGTGSPRPIGGCISVYGRFRPFPAITSSRREASRAVM